jgi:4-hydroxy-2-oxoheptanedioate aldolase
MKIGANGFKQALLNGRPQIGLWSTLASTIGADVLAPSGYDWIVIDMEHSPNEIGTVLGQLQVYASSTANAVVRVPWNEPVMVKRILDLGAMTLLFPMVQSGHEARQAVAATRYPPHGVRGVSMSHRGNRFGRAKDDYLARYCEEIAVLVQVETREALSKLDEIATVEGVDGVFFGPADLSADMGLLGQPGHPEVIAVLMQAVERCKILGKPAGILVSNDEESIAYLKAGYCFVAVGSDAGLLAKGADALLGRIKAGAGLPSR